MLKLLVTCFLALVIAISLPAQQTGSSEELKQKQAEIQREIDELKNTLKDSRHLTIAGVRQLEMVKQKLRLRQRAIGNISHQINILEGNIGKSKNEIDSLKDRLDTLKVQYARSIVYAYKLRSNYEYLSFIFSASSFNDALRRMHYLRVYREYCEDQVVAIKNTQLLLQGKITGLELTRREKDAVIQKQEKQKQELEEEKKEKNAVVKTLKSRENELKKELTAKKKADIKLRTAIQKTIELEFNKAALSPLTATNSTNTKKEVKKSALETTPEGIRISDNFKDNKGRLPWPVEKAQIKLHFGINRIPEVNLVRHNPGLTIETEPGMAVKAIFEGDVSAVFSIEGNWSVLVRHGQYFTAYSNLSSVNVAKNQKVSGGQVLGNAAINADGNGEIEFILMQERNNLDPEKWIRKK
jgi:murein hydrolase activator